MKDSLLKPGILDQCYRRLNAISEDQKPLWGTMSANQMICHLSDAIRVSLNMKEAPDRSKWWARKLARPLFVAGFPFPKGLKTYSEIHADKGGTRPRNYAEDLALLKHLMLEVSEERNRNQMQAHPLLGPMRFEEWNRFHFIHIDYHLKQFGQAR